MLSVANPATAIQAHPTDRFDDLFRLLYPSLVPLAGRLLSDRAEAEDVVQEAFLRLARAGHHNADAGRPLLEQPDEVVGAWLRRVTMNLSINRLRDRRRAEARLLRATRLDSALDLEHGLTDDDSPARALLRAEARDEVQAALATLPERQRTCLLLRHAGHSYTEIAEALGIALGSVGVYLQRGERAFRAAYRPDDSDHHPQPE